MKTFCSSIKKFSPEFKRMIYSTQTNEIERGIGFCTKNNDITLSNECIGDRCIIPLERWKSLKCKEEEHIIGHFHTHPSTIRGRPAPTRIRSDLTTDDILSAIQLGDKFSCIGYKGDKNDANVICYSYPYGVPEELANDFRYAVTEHNKDVEKAYQEGTIDKQRAILNNRKQFITENFLNPIVTIIDKEKRKYSCKFQF